MTYSFPPDVKRLIETGMSKGNYDSEDELLRDALEALCAENAEIEAIQAALAERDAGDAGVSLSEAFAEIRRRHRILADA